MADAHRWLVTANFFHLCSGVILLFGYVLFDSFTSNWQGELFTQYKMTSFQMMCGVNFFSIIFCGVSLIEQGGMNESISSLSYFAESYLMKQGGMNDSVRVNFFSIIFCRVSHGIRRYE